MTLRFGGLLIVLPLMVRHLNPDELGVWYLFITLGSLAILLDLGIGPTSTRAMSYVIAGARELSPSGFIPVDGALDQKRDQQLLADLKKTLRIFYAFLTLATILLVGTGGTLFIWEKTRHLPNNTEFILAWLCYLAGACYATYTTIWLIFLNGINGIKEAQQGAGFAIFVNYVTLIILILCGLGLWAPVLGNIAQGVTGRLIFRRSYLSLSASIDENRKGRFRSDILKSLWPQSWKSCATNMGVYLAISSGTLSASWAGGLNMVANYGLSLQLCLAIVQVATIPFSVKLTELSQLRIKDRPKEIKRIVIQRIFIYWFVTLSGAATLILFGNFFMREILRSETPLLPRLDLMMLAVFAICEGHQGIFRELIMTANKNSFYVLCIASGAVIFASTFFFARQFGLTSMILSQLIISISLCGWIIPYRGWKSV